MFQPKDPAARKFVRQFDKFTIVLCGTAAIAYGLQQYYVSAPRNTYFFTSSRSPDSSTRRDWTAHRGRYRRRSSFQRLRKAVLRNREVRCRDKTRPELSHRQRVRTRLSTIRTARSKTLPNGWLDGWMERDVRGASERASRKRADEKAALRFRVNSVNKTCTSEGPIPFPHVAECALTQ